MSEEISFGERIKVEIAHWRRKHWTFADVGAHWDDTEDYDDINEETYSYFRRFVDGLRLSDIPANSHILDLCARTGNGTLYFWQHGRVRSAVCADVSLRMGEICAQRLNEDGFHDFEWVEITHYTLPFEDQAFEAILCFETVEHVSEPEKLIADLGRVIASGGQMVLTTPNVLWEPVHALAAVLKYHHSEGPHSFIPLRKLKQMVRAAGFEIEISETTVLVPGGPVILVRIGEWIERHFRRTVMRLLGLRRILICRKI